MTELLFLMLKQKNKKREKNSLLLTEKNNNTFALIRINLYSVLFLCVHSISWMLLLNMPIVLENKALVGLFVYYMYL